MKKTLGKTLNLIEKHYQYSLNPEEFQEIKAEFQSFLESIKGMPYIEAQKLFYQNFGTLIDNYTIEKNIDTLNGIKNILVFWNVIVIFGLLVWGIIAATQG